MVGGGIGFLLGTAIGAVFVAFEGLGSGTPGGGRGWPRPMTSGRDGMSSGKPSDLGSPCR